MSKKSNYFTLASNATAVCNREREARDRPRERLLLLGTDNARSLQRWLLEQGEWVVLTDQPITVDWLRSEQITFIISYGYQHIIRPEVLTYLQGRAINLHISYLPWNRGADPNAWSFIDDTPKGVTIHCIDAGIDTGDIIDQVRLFEDWAGQPERAVGQTLATTYEALNHAIQMLFKKRWQAIREGQFSRMPQPAGGSSHRRVDFSVYQAQLTQGWDTPVTELRSMRL